MMPRSREKDRRVPKAEGLAWAVQSIVLNRENNSGILTE
jgi:hypothetical protein